MRRAILIALATLPAAPGTLQVQREEHRALTVSIVSDWEFETTSFLMELDGEPIEVPDGMRGRSDTVLERKLERIDRVLETADGVPTRVRREYLSIEGERTVGGESQQLESPFDGLVLELTRDVDDDEVEVEVVEGDEPDGEDALDGHRLALELEALLAEGELEPGDTWDLDGEALARALGFDLERVIYPRPEHERAEPGEGHDRRRGMRGGGGGGDPARWFRRADWTGMARLVADDEEWEGAECLLVKLECTGSGELTGRAEGDFEVELRGQLWFDPALALPVRLAVEIEYSDMTHMERDHGQNQMVIEKEHAGVLHHVVEVRVAAEDSGGE